MLSSAESMAQHFHALETSFELSRDPGAYVVPRAAILLQTSGKEKESIDAGVRLALCRWMCLLLGMPLLVWVLDHCPRYWTTALRSVTFVVHSGCSTLKGVLRWLPGRLFQLRLHRPWA